MQIKSLTLTGTGPTAPISVDLSRFRNGAGLLCSVDVGATAIYTVQVTGDNVHWNSHDVLKNLSASANDSLAFPVLAIRLNGTVTGGSVTLVMIQAS